MRRCAFTLVEVLIVVAIILLLVAILIPVILRSKRSAQATVCTSNLRQAGLAWIMYADAHDGVPPRTLNEYIDESSELQVLKCPLDTFEPGANSSASTYFGERVSYFTPDPPLSYLAALAAADPNHGILACVLHGEASTKFGVENPLLDTTGLVLRARLDGSVQRAHVGHICVSDGSGSLITTRSNWTLFTDEWPCPEPWCPAGSYRCD